MSSSVAHGAANTIYIDKHATRLEACGILEEVTCQRTFKEKDHEPKSVPIMYPGLL